LHATGKRGKFLESSGRASGEKITRLKSFDKHDQDPINQRAKRRIADLNLDDFLHVPTVIIFADGFFRDTEFIVDTGAAPNLIKEKCLHSETRIRTNR